MSWSIFWLPLPTTRWGRPVPCVEKQSHSMTFSSIFGVMMCCHFLSNMVFIMASKQLRFDLILPDWSPSFSLACPNVVQQTLYEFQHGISSEMEYFLVQPWGNITFWLLWNNCTCYRPQMVLGSGTNLLLVLFTSLSEILQKEHLAVAMRCLWCNNETPFYRPSGWTEPAHIDYHLEWSGNIAF